MLIDSPPDGKTLTVAIIGLPRSGSTIFASYVNSLPGAMIWGEPHRSKGISNPIIMKSRYGNMHMNPQMDILAQINMWADKHNLWLCGFKEVFDPIVGVLPMELVGEYGGDRIDKIFVTIRDPRKNWSSLSALGHAKGLSLSKESYVLLYKSFVDYAISSEKASPIILERFLASPNQYTSKKIGVTITGSVKLEQYTGGGDPITIATGTKMRKHDDRPSYPGPSMNFADSEYARALRVDKLR